MRSVTQLWLIWRSSIKTKSLNTKPCPAGLSPRIICQPSPFLPNMSQNCCTDQVWTVPPSTELLWVTLGMGEKSYLTAKDLFISPIRKPPINRFKSFAVKSLISSPSNNNFQVIILCNLDLKLQSFMLYHILNFRLYVHTCQANLTNQCLLNVVFSMTKGLNDSSSPKQNLHSLHLSIPFLPPVLFRKHCLYYCLFSSFSLSLFYIKLCKISTDSAPIGILWLCGLIKYKGFQICGNKSNDTPYSMP